MKKEVATTEVIIFGLTPMNEGHEIPYMEKFSGSIAGMITRCRDIVSGLEKILPNGTFTVKVQDGRFLNRKSWYVNKTNVLDEDWNVIM